MYEWKSLHDFIIHRNLHYYLHFGSTLEILKTAQRLGELPPLMYRLLESHGYNKWIGRKEKRWEKETMISIETKNKWKYAGVPVWIFDLLRFSISLTYFIFYFSSCFTKHFFILYLKTWTAGTEGGVRSIVYFFDFCRGIAIGCYYFTMA